MIPRFLSKVLKEPMNTQIIRCNPTNAVGGIEFGHFPEGDPASSPGLLYSATLGKRANEFGNPNGVVAKLGAYSDPADFV